MSLIFISSCSSNPLAPDNEKQMRGLIADLQINLSESREEILKLNGKIEEVEHHSNKRIEASTKESSENIMVLTEQVKALRSFQETQQILNANVAQLIQENNELLINVDKNYDNFRNNDKLSVNYKEKLKQATDAFSAKNYKEALDEYSFFLDKPHVLTKDEYQIVLYRVALSEYRLDMNEASIVHFSQLYEKFHKENDKYMASSLFHIGSLLVTSNKCSDARKVFEQIMIQYKHQYFKDEAKKRIQEIDNSSACKGSPIKS